MDDGPKSASVAASSEPEVLRAAFAHTTAGDAANCRFILDSTPGINKVVRREKILNVVRASASLPIVWGLVYYVTEREIGEGAIAVASIVMVLLGCLISMWATSAGGWVRFRNALKQASRAPASETPGVQIEVEVGPRGVRWAHSDQAVEYGWSYFDRVDVLDEFVVLQYANAGSGVSIPRSCFGSPERADHFVQRARELLAASGHSFIERHRVTLDSGRIHCSACGYSLKGLTEPKCPECGRVVVGLAISCSEILSRPLWKDVVMLAKRQHPASNRAK